MTITKDTRLQRARDVAHQAVGTGDNDTVILSLESGVLYTCNEVTGAFLDAAKDGRTLGEIIDILEGQFDVPREQLEADLIELAEKLLREKLIVEVARGGAEGN